MINQFNNMDRTYTDESPNQKFMRKGSNVKSSASKRSYLKHGDSSDYISNYTVGTNKRVVDNRGSKRQANSGSTQSDSTTSKENNKK